MGFGREETPIDMDALESFQELAREKEIREFQLFSYQQNQLIITGSSDHAYYHQMELRFENCPYLTLPAEFSNAVFRYGEDDDYERIRRIVELESSHKIIHIEAETPAALDPLNFYVVAEELSVNQDMVYHYLREKLNEGERLAPWLRAS